MSLRPVRRKRFGTSLWFLLLVLLPTALVGGYYAGYAADLYESEARFQVRGRGASTSAAAGIGAIAGMPAALRSGGEESQAVKNFVDSYDAVTGLRRQLDLISIWRRPEADLLAKLWWDDPEAERLLRYYRRRVTLHYDIETGVSTLRVLAFRPGDAQAITAELLRMSEELVNRFSLRSIEDGMRAARQEVAAGEARVLAAREALVVFREREQALDPTQSAVGAIQRIQGLEQALGQARAELQERRSFMRPDNPQIQVLNNRIAALTQQITTERGRVTRGDEALTQQVAGYERLQLEREFADRQLASALASLEAARSDALRQQVFLMRVAEPNLPERALYPTGVFTTLTVFLALSVTFGVAWLLIAGAREHAS
jgi:capsular polysaccharide transport system permease protein